LRLAEPNRVYAEALRTIFSVKISIFPLDDVGVGATPPAHFMVIAEPLIVNVVGMYPVEP
jgi:hypothetical protein